MTFFGLSVAIALLATGHRPHFFHGFVWFETGEHWGGFECGPIFVVQRHAQESVKRHEAGHGLQNMLLGPFMPFLISLPSAIRYHYRAYLRRKGRGAALPPYDSIWFEKWATEWGERYFLPQRESGE